MTPLRGYRLMKKTIFYEGKKWIYTDGIFSNFAW